MTQSAVGLSRTSADRRAKIRRHFESIVGCEPRARTSKLLDQKIYETAHARGGMSLSEEHGVDALLLAAVKVFEQGDKPPLSDILADLEPAKSSDPEASESNMAQSFTAIAAEVSFDRQIDRIAIDPKRPFVESWLEIIGQAVVREQSLWVLRPTVAIEVARRRDHDTPALTDLACLQ